MQTKIKVKLIYILFFCSTILCAQKNFNKTDTAAFEKKYKEIDRIIDTIHYQNDDSFVIRDSLEQLQEAFLLDVFLDTSTFNYSFKTCSCVLKAKNLQVLALDQHTGGSFHSVETYYRFKDASGKIHFMITDGSDSGSEENNPENNLFYSDIYLLDKKQDLYILIGSGTGCNSCHWMGAKTMQINDTILSKYDAFSSGSCYFITDEAEDSLNSRNVIFDDGCGVSFDAKKRELIINYEIMSGNDQKIKAKEKFWFNGKIFDEK